MSETPGPSFMSMARPFDSQNLGAGRQPEGARMVSSTLPMLDDLDLVRRLGHVKLTSVDVAVWRHLSLREIPGSGEGARGMGGRFNPPGSFPVVYGTLGRVAAGAELRRIARSNPIGIEKLLPRHLYRFRLRSTKVVDLRQPSVREALGLPRLGLLGVDAVHTQLVGEVARALGIEVIAAPSATGIGDIVAIFSDLIPGSTWDIRHVELWTSADDVPALNEQSDLGFSGMTG